MRTRGENGWPAVLLSAFFDMYVNVYKMSRLEILTRHTSFVCAGPYTSPHPMCLKKTKTHKAKHRNQSTHYVTERGAIGMRVCVCRLFVRENVWSIHNIRACTHTHTHHIGSDKLFCRLIGCRCARSRIYTHVPLYTRGTFGGLRSVCRVRVRAVLFSLPR